MFKGIRSPVIDLTARSLKKISARTRQQLSRLAEFEAQALRDSLLDARARMQVASQAGDASTLISDQIELLPNSRERLRRNWQGVLAILRQAVMECSLLGRDYWQALKRTPWLR